MPPRIRMSPQTASVLAGFLAQRREWRYGYDLSRETTLKSGTLYPILMRLANCGWLETAWTQPEEMGRPPRHMYRLTPKGVRCAQEKLAPKARHALTRRAYGTGRD